MMMYGHANDDVRPRHDDVRPRHDDVWPRYDDVRPRHGVALQKQPGNTNKFGKPIPGSISVIVNQYKSSVQRWCNQNKFAFFKWQSKFHDHIIRDEQSFQNIARYISNNPANWKDDNFF